MKVDDKNVLDRASNGRESILLRSRQLYGPGAMVLDIDHVPQIGCGARPRAFLADNDNREIVPIDIYPWQNHMGMVTTSNCTGIHTLNCNSNKFQKCYVRFGTPSETATDFFNDIDGVVVTAQWREDEINMWIHTRRDLQRMVRQDDAPQNPLLGPRFDTGRLGLPLVALNRTRSLCGEYKTPIFPKEMRIVSIH
jgi:hypothetical protein